MAESDTDEGDRRRRDDAAKLIAVTINLLEDDREQNVRDYLNHALGALDRIRQAGVQTQKKQSR